MIRSVLCASALFMITGCGVVAPKYTSDYETFNQIKEKGLHKTNVGDFKGAQASTGKISVRGNPVSSPHGGDLLDYIKYGLTLELTNAGIYDENNTQCQIEATVQNIDLDTSDLSEGKGTLSINYHVIRDGNEAYSKLVTINQSFENSFMGAVAIPNAANAIPVMVRRSIQDLFSDEQFVKTLSE